MAVAKPMPELPPEMTTCLIWMFPVSDTRWVSDTGKLARTAECRSLLLLQCQQRAFAVGEIGCVQHLKSRVVLAIERGLRRWAASILGILG